MSYNSSGKSNGTCEICTQAAGTDFCNDCDKLFCKNCKVLHVRTKSNRFHTFRNNDFVRREEHRPNCEQHKEEFIYYCEICDEPSCKVCIFTTHKGHNMSDIADTVAKKKKELSSTWELYVRRLEGARHNVDKMETSLQKYRLKVYKTIEEIQQEADKLKCEIDRTVTMMVKELREKETEELRRISSVVNKLKSQIQSGNQLEQHISRAMKMRHDTSMLISLQKFQKEMESYIPEVVLPHDFSYLKGNTAFATVQSLLGRLFFENEKIGRGTPSGDNGDPRANVRKYDLWVCQMCNSERYIDHSEQSEERSFKTPRCCYGFMLHRGNVYK